MNFIHVHKKNPSDHIHTCRYSFNQFISLWLTDQWSVIEVAFTMRDLAILFPKVLIVDVSDVDIKMLSILTSNL